MKLRIGDRFVEVTPATTEGLVPLVWRESARGAFFIVSFRGRILDGHAVATEEGWRIWLGGETIDVARCLADEPEDRDRPTVIGPVKAPYACRLLAIHVEAGQTVTEGTPLCRLESMKMEQDILAPGPARVASLQAEADSVLTRGQAILTLEPATEKEEA